MNMRELTEFFGEYVDLGGVELREDAVLGEDVQVDSRDMLRILSRIESRCKVRFPPQEILRLRTAGDIGRLVERMARR